MSDLFGLDQLNRIAVDLAAAGAEGEKIASVAVRKTAFDIEATAEELVPVDTSATKGSIFASGPGGEPLGPGSLQAEIGPTTEYAPYLEFGTSRMAPYAFMGPALDRHAPEFAQAIRENIAGARILK